METRDSVRGRHEPGRSPLLQSGEGGFDSLLIAEGAKAFHCMADLPELLGF